MTVPDDFTYKYKLKEYSSKVEKINKNLGIIKRNIQKTIRNFENMEKANANILNSNFKALSISGSAYSTGARVANETIDPRLATDPFSEQYVDSNNISLEELKEDMHFFTDIQDALNNTGAKISEWFNSATSTLVKGVKATALSISQGIHIYETINSLEEALSRNSLPNSMKLYRATGSKHLREQLKNGEELTSLIGKKISNEGFTSTSPLYDCSFALIDKYDTILRYIYLKEARVTM